MKIVSNSQSGGQVRKKIAQITAVVIIVLMEIMLSNEWGAAQEFSVPVDIIPLKRSNKASIQVSNEIIVDFAKERELNPLILGHNVLAYDPCNIKPSGDCINRGELSNYGAGQWSALDNKPNTELVMLAQEVKTSILRFPGGCGVHHYNWKQTIGPLDKRPMFRFGLDEFLRLCEAIGSQAIITLSYFDGTDQDLADMIEYLNYPQNAGNFDGGIDWAELRAKNGHAEPYNVKLFEFGNETYHGDHRSIGSIDPDEYAKRYLSFRNKLKNIDPAIQLGAVLEAGPFGLTYWATLVAQKIMSSMDFGTLHVYPVKYRSTSPTLSTEELFRITLAAPDQIKNLLEVVNAQLGKYSGNNIPIAITEYNGGLKRNEPIPYRHCLGNALFIADMLRILLATETPILCANYWQFSNSYYGMVYNPIHLKNKGQYIKRPVYNVFEMYTKHFGSILLDTIAFSSGYTSPGYGKVMATTDKFTEVSSADPWEITSQPISTDSWKVRFKIGVKVNKNPEEVKVSFVGNKDINYFHTRVKASVLPTHRYRLTALMKTEEISLSSGVSLQVTDIRGVKETNWVIATHKVSGTTDWNNVMVEFQPLDDSKAINISIRRVSGGGPVSGNVRVKDVVLEDLGPATHSPPTPYLSVLASTNEAHDRLYLMVINKHLTDPMTAMIQVKHFPLSTEGKSWILNGPAVDATNENNIEDVKISQGTFSVSPRAEKIEFIFEPHSLTAIELGKKQD